MHSTIPTHGRPWWLGLAVMLLGAVCLYAASQLPITAQYAGIGPGMLLVVIGVVFLLLGVLLLIQIARGEVFEALDAENAAAHQSMDRRAFATALVAVMLPTLIMDPLGLPITAMCSFMLVARAFGSRRVCFDLVIGLILGSVCWLLFTWLGLQLGGLLPVVGW